MAEAAIVGFVLVKLANIIENEIKFLGGVGKKVKRVQRELTRIQCCMRDADTKRNGDERVRNWLNELRNVAYRIEDTTDIFFLEVEDHVEKDPSFLQNNLTLWQKFKQLYMWCLCEKPQKVIILHELGTKLDDILNTLKEISNSRVEYGIQNLQDNVGEPVRRPIQRAVYHVDETEVVSLQTHRNKILQLLLHEETSRRAVITIVGPGGLGKTTLARLVYRSASANFDYHIMLSISQQFSLSDLLTKMLHQLKDSKPENLDEEYLINKLRSELKDKKYLIILDDVWQVDLWRELQIALPDDKNRSRILITSRFINVATSADSRMVPYELGFLDDESSRDLLLKKAFPFSEPCEECPDDLKELAGNLSKRCKGLPLALIVLGGILSTKGPSYHAWERVFRTMDWHIDGKGCIDVLALSYQDMPYYLKPCFIYLASFPEDYEIPAKSLIRMWVAEGFIPHEVRKTMEETAEDYLEELFQRCMVQVSSRNMNGSIKCFQVHDLLRDIAIHEARQENFVTVFSEASDVNQPNNEIRRASFQSCSQQFMKYVGQSTQSILWFPQLGIEVKNIPMCSKFRLLKVLELVSVKTNDSIRGLDELIHLKYLAIRDSESMEGLDSCSFHRMKTLETLDLRKTYHQPHDSLWTIGTLRHVLIENVGSVNTPLSTINLRNIQTMRWVCPERFLAREIPHLKNLRKLGLSCAYEENWVTVTNLLKTLPNLVSLQINGSSLPKEIVYPNVLPMYDNLQSLYLNGKWPENVTLEASSFPRHLLKLTLIWSKLEENPIPELGKLERLKKLCLGRDVTNWSVPRINPVGFPALQYLEVGDYVLNGRVVGQGVMPKLTHLRLFRKIRLFLPPELQHVRYL